MPLLATNVSDGDVVIEWAFAAEREAVWERFINTDSLAEWLGKPVVAELRPGGSLAIDHGDGYVCQSDVLEIEADTRLSLSWYFPDEHETNVSFDLTDTPRAEQGYCQLVVRHSNLAALADCYRIGWPVHLTYLEAVVHGDPIPTSQLWNLHATLETLGGGSTAA